MKFLLIALMALSSAAFSKETLQPSVVQKLNSKQQLDKLRVYLSKRSVVVREYERVSNTDVNGGVITSSLKRVVEKTILTKRIKGKIISVTEGNTTLYVSFDKNCAQTACAYKFDYEPSYTKGYGLAALPNIAGSEVVDAYKGLVNSKEDRPDSNYYTKRVKLEFSQRELNNTIKRTVRPDGFDAE